jgi:hypothetical protein
MGNTCSNCNENNFEKNNIDIIINNNNKNNNKKYNYNL